MDVLKYVGSYYSNYVTEAVIFSLFMVASAVPKKMAMKMMTMRSEQKPPVKDL
jgi:hypothetical protein